MKNKIIITLFLGIFSFSLVACDSNSVEIEEPLVSEIEENKQIDVPLDHLNIDLSVLGDTSIETKENVETSFVEAEQEIYEEIVIEEVYNNDSFDETFAEIFEEKPSEGRHVFGEPFDEEAFNQAVRDEKPSQTQEYYNESSNNTSNNNQIIIDNPELEKIFESLLSPSSYENVIPEGDSTGSLENIYWINSDWNMAFYFSNGTSRSVGFGMEGMDSYSYAGDKLTIGNETYTYKVTETNLYFIDPSGFTLVFKRGTESEFQSMIQPSSFTTNSEFVGMSVREFSNAGGSFKGHTSHGSDYVFKVKFPNDREGRLKLNGYVKDILDKEKFDSYEDLLGDFIISEVEIN